MVQVQPTQTPPTDILNSPFGIFQVLLLLPGARRLELNDPPASAGGLSIRKLLHCRLHLKYPPPAGGGIPKQNAENPP